MPHRFVWKFQTMVEIDALVFEKITRKNPTESTPMSKLNKFPDLKHTYSFLKLGYVNWYK